MQATEAKTGHIDKNEVFGGLSKAEEALLTALLEKKKRTNLGEGSLSSSVGIDTLKKECKGFLDTTGDPYLSSAKPKGAESKGAKTKGKGKKTKEADDVISLKNQVNSLKRQKLAAETIMAKNSKLIKQLQKSGKNSISRTDRPHKTPNRYGTELENKPSKGGEAEDKLKKENKELEGCIYHPEITGPEYPGLKLSDGSKASSTCACLNLPFLMPPWRLVTS